MKSFLLLLTLTVIMAFGVSSCVQTHNSSSSDAATYGSIVGTDNFQAAHQILVSKCIGCHTDFGATADVLVSSGYVVTDDSLNSPIYYRLQNSDGSNGPKTMPMGAPALSSSDLAAIKTWIDSM